MYGYFQEDIYEKWFNADSGEPEEFRDGSLQHPYKYIREMTLPAGSEPKILNFIPAAASYRYDEITQVNALITLKDVQNLVIRKADGAGSVLFNGRNDSIIYDFGVLIFGTSSNIEIDGVDFLHFRYNVIKVQGPLAGYISDIKIRNSRLYYNTGSYSLTANCAAVKMQHVRNILIENCDIRQGNYNAELDGIFMDACEDVVIKNNNIVLEENEYLPQHLDCIEITQRPDGPYSGNVTIENNHIENASTQGVTFRQGVHVLYTFGKIKIFNNLIISGRGRGLLNIFFHNNTDSLLIFNNTLIGKNNPHNLLRIKNADNREDFSLLNIKNNIFYKEGTGSPVYALSTWFDGLSLMKFNNQILNYNLYWNNDLSVIPSIQFDDGTFHWKADSSRMEKNGLEVNPSFNDDYTLDYYSEAKNNGEGLLYEGIRTDKYGNERPYWNSDFDIGAFEIEDTQLKIGVTDVDEDIQVTHFLKAEGRFWEKSKGDEWLLSNDPDLNDAVCVTYGSVGDSTGLNTLTGFTYKWLYRNNTISGDIIAAGLYTVMNNLNPTAYFYLDLRDAITAYSPNIYLRFNNVSGEYQYFKDNWGNNIPNGTVLRIWNINNRRPKTVLLEEYWNNVLSLIKNEKLIWGPDPGEIDSTIYLLCYQTDSPSWEIADSITGKYEYEFVSRSLQNSFNSFIKYAVVSVSDGITDTSNIVYDELLGEESGNNEYIYYSLDQNYPNPFNPRTNIRFSIPHRQHIELKIYDLLGREAAVLIDEELPPGTYVREWNASAYASGIYFYRLTTENYSASGKMILLE
jgi:hypothetical protein